MKTIAERLRHARHIRGWTQSQLAAAAGVSQGTIGNIESGVRQARGSLPQIAEALGVAHKWLADGVGPSLSASEPTSNYSLPNASRQVPLVRLTLQPGVQAFETQADPGLTSAPVWFHRHGLSRLGGDLDALIAIRVESGAMEPALFEGDTVVIHTGLTEPVDGAVFAVNHDGDLLLRRLMREAGQWWLCADNPDQARFPRKRHTSEAVLIGRIILKQSEHI